MKGARRPARAPPPSCECFPTSDDRNCARLVACRHHTSRQRMVQGECRPNYRPVSKTTGGLRKTRHHGTRRVGWMFTFVAAAYNLVRIPRLLSDQT